MQATRRAPLISSDIAGQPVSGRSRTRALLLFCGVAAIGYGVDLGTKELALSRLDVAGYVPVVGDWFGLFLTSNSGAAFSLGTSYTLVLTWVAILAATVTVVVAARRLRSTGWAWGLGFLLAGILGNLSDRILREPEPMRGHVIDFLRFPNFPVFNVADICINIAAGFIVVQALRGVRVDGSREQR
ncbi:MAG: signal peptidase II [Nocardioides sp.]